MRCWTVWSPQRIAADTLAGNLDAATILAEAVVAELMSANDRAYASTHAVFLADLLLLRGTDAQAERYLAIAEQHALPSDVLVQFMQRAVRARLLARTGEFAAAETLARDATALSSMTDVLRDRARVHLALAEVLSLAGKPAAARREQEVASEPCAGKAWREPSSALPPHNRSDYPPPPVPPPEGICSFRMAHLLRAPTLGGVANRRLTDDQWLAHEQHPGGHVTSALAGNRPAGVDCEGGGGGRRRSSRTGPRGRSQTRLARCLPASARRRRSGRLDAADIENLAEAAWWTGHLEEALALRARAYAEFAQSGERDRAALVASTLAIDHIVKGAMSVAGG